MIKRFALAVLLLSLVAAGAVMADSPVLINAAGATFPYPIYSKWFDVYHDKNQSIQINYASVGSGAGIAQLTNGTVDFGASDGPMNDDQIKDFKDKRGTGVLHFPTVLGAAVPIYNVAGVSSDLNFTQKALAGIYLGTITKWNDPEIAKANKGVKLPADGYRRGSPLGWQRHDLHLDGFSLQGQRGLVDESRKENFSELAGGTGWQGQRRRIGVGEANAGLDRLRRIDLRGAEQDVLRKSAERRRKIRQGGPGERGGGSGGSGEINAR